jgi:thiamine biosynthesis lipoprotein
VRTVESIHVAAMGTDAHLLVVDAPLGLLHHATNRLAELEARWSRFVPTSDIARGNAAGGRAVPVHDDTMLLVRRATEAWQRTGGRFDPTVHDALVAQGYDRPFAHFASAPSERGGGAVHPAPGCGGIVLDLDAGTVRLPVGVRLDPGGIGKGLAADLLVDELRRLGAGGALVNIGGDLRAGGAAPDGTSWTIEIEHPFDTSRRVGLLAFASGQDVAVATSSTLGRRWTHGGRDVHHLLDPRTGRPMRSAHVAVTVVGTQAWRADVTAKVLLDGGPWTPAFGAEPPSLRFVADGGIERRAGIDALLHLDPELLLDPHLQPTGAVSDDAVATEEALACSPR